MKRLALPALLLSVVAPRPAAQDPGAGGTPPGSTSIDGLSLGGLLRAFFTTGDDTILTFGDPVASVRLDEAQVYGELERGDFLLRAQLELESGTAVLEDGYVAWTPCDGLALKLGQFKPRILHSASVDPERLVLRDRTLLGEGFDTYDHGVELSGYDDPFRWFVAVTNGADGEGDGAFSSARLEWSVYEGELGLAEGAHGAPNHLVADFGFFVFFDSATKSSGFDAGGFGADLAFTIGPWFAHSELAVLRDFFPQTTVAVHGQPAVTLQPDSHPVAVTLGNHFASDWQATFRWEGADDLVDTDHYAVSLNHFAHGGSLVFTGEVGYYEANGPQGWVYSLGATVGANRPSHVREF